MSAATGNTNGRAQNRTHRNKRRTQTLSRSPLTQREGGGVASARQGRDLNGPGRGFSSRSPLAAPFSFLQEAGKKGPPSNRRCVFHLLCPGRRCSPPPRCRAAPAMQTKEGNLVAPLFPSAWIIHSQVRVSA